MNIVIAYDKNDIILEGLSSAIQCVEPSTALWFPAHKSPFDMFDELKPNYLIVPQKLISKNIARAIESNPNAKIITYGNGCNIDIPQPMANLAQYNRGTRREGYESDILYISNIPPMDKIIQILTSLIKDYKVKIVGNYPIKLPQYLGQATNQEITDLMVSTKVGLDNGTMSLTYSINKVMSVSETEIGLSTSYNTIDELQRYLTNENLKINCIKDNYKEAIDNTYFHTANHLFVSLNLPELAQKSLSFVERLTTHG